MFYKRNGFINHYKINSGDDDLFINQAANKINTSICIAPESFTYSIPEKQLGLWLKQKKRHLSTSGLYKLKHRLLLMFYPISLFLFYVSSIILLVLNSWLIVVLVLFTLRLLSFFLIQKSALPKLKEQKLLLLSPLLETIIVILGVIINLSNMLLKQRKWK